MRKCIKFLLCELFTRIYKCENLRAWSLLSRRKHHMSLSIIFLHYFHNETKISSKNFLHHESQLVVIGKNECIKKPKWIFLAAQFAVAEIIKTMTSFFMKLMLMFIPGMHVSYKNARKCMMLMMKRVSIFFDYV